MADQDFICPVCGAEVPAKALACPACGSDENTGWSANTVYDGTGIEDPGEFDHEAWQRRERGSGRVRPALGWFWWAVAVVVLVALVWWLVRGGL